MRVCRAAKLQRITASILDEDRNSEMQQLSLEFSTAGSRSDCYQLLSAIAAADAIRITTLLRKATRNRSGSDCKTLLTSVTCKGDAGHG